MKVSLWNYIVPIRLFIHYLGKSGNSVRVELKDYDHIPKHSALYLALGHYSYLSGKGIYDFNTDEWPNWLIRAGKPFWIYWDVK